MTVNDDQNVGLNNVQHLESIIIGLNQSFSCQWIKAIYFRTIKKSPNVSGFPENFRDIPQTSSGAPKARPGLFLVLPSTAQTLYLRVVSPPFLMVC